MDKNSTLFQEKMMTTKSYLSDKREDGSLHGIYLGYHEYDDFKQKVVMVCEIHGDKLVKRKFDLSTVVHALLNLEEDEEFELEFRDPSHE